MKERHSFRESTDHSLKKIFKIIRNAIFLLIVGVLQTLAIDTYSPDPDLQQKTIRGTVVDKKGEPLPGVNVILTGKTIGVTTGTDGKYSITIPDGSSSLTFSFIGMKAKTIPIGSLLQIDVTLEEQSLGLDEVVVVGYGIQKKESVVGAISQVNNTSLMNSGNSNITNAIAGKLSGVLTIQGTGEPGANNAEIVVRGLSSWNGSSPLILVDGVERDFSNLDPNEINSISVLKDASATAVFGAKGANGVIIVATKRGALGKPKLEFTGSIGFQKASGVRQFIDSYTTMSALNVALRNSNQYSSVLEDGIINEYRNPSTPLNALRYPSVDWFKLLTVPLAPMYNGNLNISGGTNFVKYFSSFGYQYEGSLFKSTHNGYDDARYKNSRFNYRTNLDFSLSRTTQLALNLGGDISIKNQPYTYSGSTSDCWEALWETGPGRFPAYYPSWVLEQVPDLDYPGSAGIRIQDPFGERHGNPYQDAMTGSFRNYTSARVFTDLILDQKLDFILKGLSFKGKVSLSSYYSTTSLYADYNEPAYKLYWDRIGVDANNDGVVDQNPWERRGQGNEILNTEPLAINVGGLNGGYYSDLYYEMALNYANTFGQHSVTAMALLNRQQKNRELEFPYYNEALAGRATYDYSRKYLLELNIGYTGSERFAPKNRFGFFPAGAVGWVVSEESFFKNAVPWMSKLKLRYSDGLVGSDYASSRWLYISQYYASGNFINEDQGANLSAQWEEARKRDVGLELGFFKNTLTFNVDLFDEQRTKMLLAPRTVTFLVGSSFKDLNLGALKKHGIEFEAEYRKTTASNISYFVKGLFGYNENRIIYKDDLPYAPDYAKSAGKPLGLAHNFGDDTPSGIELIGSGYFSSVNDIHNNTSPNAVTALTPGDYSFLDYNSDGIISSADKFAIKGSDYPPITYSFSGGITYKGFDFNFLFQGDAGKYVIFNNNFWNEFVMGNYSMHIAQLDYWTPTNTDATHAALHYFSGGANNPLLSWGGGSTMDGYDIRIPDHSWRNADYIRLKDVYLGYTFDAGIVKKYMGISKMQVYATGNNLLTFTKLIEGDPERRDYRYGFYPLMMTVKLGIKLSF